MQEQGDDGRKIERIIARVRGDGRRSSRGGGAEGGGSECVASGVVVQWCSGARLVAAGVPVRMDDGSDTW